MQEAVKPMKVLIIHNDYQQPGGETVMDMSRGKEVL